jgi:uncharacterized protein|tara:strand:- start:257 stop:652 length:396 start_codon:yes stop_codon:yes gene_type:complete
MKAIGPELPLNRSEVFGQFSLITTYKDEIQQNFKNLLLTSPGERMMNPDFGVGIRRFLFNSRNEAISSVRQRIQNQVSKYMPFIRNLKINFDSNTNQEFLDNSNILSITIIYDIPNLNISSQLVVTREEIS